MSGVRAGEVAGRLRGALDPPPRAGAERPVGGQPAGSVDPAGQPEPESKFSLRLYPDEAVAFDRLVLGLRRRLRRPVTRADVLRALMAISGDDPTVLDLVAEELARAAPRRRDVTAPRRHDGAQPGRRGGMTP